MSPTLLLAPPVSRKQSPAMPTELAGAAVAAHRPDRPPGHPAVAGPVPPERVTEIGGRTVERFRLPLEEAFLCDLLTDVFATHWHEIIFGPLIQGAAYEIRCPNAPQSITLLDGYMTVQFGGTHFHLCIGENLGPRSSPTPEALRRHRRTAAAEFFRGLDRHGAPVTWGLRLSNGAGEQQITIFFPNPFLTDDDGLREQPDWSRLAAWDRLRARWLGIPEPDPFDRSGRGFHHG